MGLIDELKAAHEAATAQMAEGDFHSAGWHRRNAANGRLEELMRKHADEIIAALEQRGGCGCPCHWDEGSDPVNAWRDGYDTADAEITPLLKSVAAERDQLRRVVEAAREAEKLWRHRTRPHASFRKVSDALDALEEKDGCE